MNRTSPRDCPTVREAWKHLRELVPLRDYGKGIWCCGGAVRDLMEGRERPRHDVDLFFADGHTFASVRLGLERGLQAELLTDQKGKVSLLLPGGLKVDLVREVFESAEALSMNADFSIASGVMELATGELVHQELFFPDLAARVARTANLPHPLRSLPRAVRYAQMGYSLGYGDMMRIAHHIAREGLEKSGAPFDWDP